MKISVPLLGLCSFLPIVDVARPLGAVPPAQSGQLPRIGVPARTHRLRVRFWCGWLRGWANRRRLWLYLHWLRRSVPVQLVEFVFQLCDESVERPSEVSEGKVAAEIEGTGEFPPVMDRRRLLAVGH